MVRDSNFFIDLGLRVGEIAVKNTVSLINDKIATAKAKKDDKQTIQVLEEIINDLIEDKNELIRILRLYEDEFITQRMSEKDIEYITKNFVPVIEQLLKKATLISDDKAIYNINEIIDTLKPLISVETFTILQLLGFNFKKAIGEPLTKLLNNVIESKMISDKDNEIKYLTQQVNLEYFKMINNEDSYNRYMSLTQK